MWRYFTLGEFACKHCGRNFIDYALVSELDELRHEVAFPLVVTSGYRCPEYNATISSTGRSGPHTTGRAVDVAVSHFRAYRVLQVALLMRFTGIGIHQRGDDRFIHLDNLPNAPGQPRPTLWSY